jgi:hypothetical protein
MRGQAGDNERKKQRQREQRKGGRHFTGHVKGLSHFWPGVRERGGGGGGSERKGERGREGGREGGRERGVEGNGDKER